MTMQADIIQLLMESAPTDPFDDEGPRKYRVAAVIGRGARRRHKVELTREHDSEAEAMLVVADKIKYAADSTMLHAALTQMNVLQARIDVLERQLAEAQADTKKRRR